MKKLFIFAALFAAVTSCSKNEVDGVVMGDGSAETHIIKLNTASTRVSINDDTNDTWTFKWDSGETIGVWHSDGIQFNEYTLNDDNSFVSDASVDYAGTSTEESRILNPYVSTKAYSESLDIKINSQSSSSEPYMISAKYETIATDGSVSYDLYHIGAFVDLYINIESGSELIGESISQVDVTGFNSGATIDLGENLFSDDEKTNLNSSFYSTFTPTTIAVTHTAFALVEGQSNKVRFNILPTTIAKDGEVSVMAKIGDNKYKTTITNDGDTAIEFARAKHHKLYCTITEDDLASTWVDKAAEEYAGGDGESSDTAYQISTAEQLGLFAKNVNAGTDTDAYFKLTQSLNLSAYTWEPIGSSSNKFTGTFDGGGFTIEGITIEASSQYQGLFGYISAATVKNVSVDGTIYTSGNNAGGVAGYCVSSSLIDNCHNAASVTAYTYAGGIVGQNSVSTVINCSNSGAINATYKSGGGIVGASGGVVDSNNAVTDPAYVINCYNIGEFMNIGSSGNIGGIVGYNQAGSTVSNCYGAGKVTASAATKSGMVIGNHEGIATYYYFDNTLLDTADSSFNKGIGKTADFTTGAMTTANMQADGFVTTLNGYSTGRSDLRKWKAVTEDYPTFDTGYISAQED